MNRNKAGKSEPISNLSFTPFSYFEILINSFVGPSQPKHYFWMSFFFFSKKRIVQTITNTQKHTHTKLYIFHLCAHSLAAACLFSRPSLVILFLRPLPNRAPVCRLQSSLRFQTSLCFSFPFRKPIFSKSSTHVAFFMLKLSL